MAPVCTDPRQIVVALQPGRRAALFELVDEIVTSMVQDLECSSSELGPLSADDDFSAGKSDATAGEKQQQQQQPPGDEEGDFDLAATLREVTQLRSQEEKEEQARRVLAAASQHVRDWRDNFLPKLKEIVQVKDTGKIEKKRKLRTEALGKREPEDGRGDDDTSVDETSQDPSSLQALYPPLPTELTAIPVEDRREIVSCLMLLLLSTGKYSSYSRTLLVRLTSSLDISLTFLNNEEVEVAMFLMESGKATDEQKVAMTAEGEAAKRREENHVSRLWKVGLASVAGATLLGVTGGLAAPLVAGAMGTMLGGVGLGGVASFLSIFWLNTALVATLFGAYGGRMTGKMMDRYAKEIEDFSFIPLVDDQSGRARDQEADRRQREGQKAQDPRRLRVTIGINGWLNTEDDITKPWRVLPSDTEVFALRYELKTLLALGSAMKDFAQSVAWKTLRAEVIKRTALVSLASVLWPVAVVSTASNFDNPFMRARNRSKMAGRLLADALINKVQGERPVTLIGYSLGATAIHSCLQSLAERHAFGLVDTVVMMGAPAPSDPTHWRTLHTVVSGRIFNAYSKNDMILGLVYRMHSLGLGAAGLRSIDGVVSLKNLNLSETVSGHLRYPSLTGEILRQCGFPGVKASARIEKDDEMKKRDDQGGSDLLDLETPPSDLGAAKTPPLPPRPSPPPPAYDTLELPPPPMTTERESSPAPPGRDGGRGSARRETASAAAQDRG